MEVQFAPQQPLVVDTFKSCEGLSRIAYAQVYSSALERVIFEVSPSPIGLKRRNYMYSNYYNQYQ